MYTGICHLHLRSRLLTATVRAVTVPGGEKTSPDADLFDLCAEMCGSASFLTEAGSQLHFKKAERMRFLSSFNFRPWLLLPCRALAMVPFSRGLRSALYSLEGLTWRKSDWSDRPHHEVWRTSKIEVR